jgi:hypothetical protein
MTVSAKLIVDFDLIRDEGPAVTFGTPFRTDVAYWCMRDFGAQSKGPG